MASDSLLYALGILCAVCAAAINGLSFVFNKKSTAGGNGAENNDTDQALLPAEQSESRNTKSSARNFLTSCNWWIFFSLTSGSELLGMLAYNLAPAMIIAPLGSLAVLSSCVFAWLMFEEIMSGIQKSGIFLALFGCSIIVVNTNPMQELSGFKVFVDQHLLSLPFLIFLLVSSIIAVIMIFLRNRHFMFRLLFCVVISAYVNTSCKSVGIAVKAWMRGTEKPEMFLENPYFWAIVVVMVSSIPVYLIHITKVIGSNDKVSITVPIFFVCNSTGIVLANAILFREYHGLGVVNIVSIALAFGVAMVGVFNLYGY